MRINNQKGSNQKLHQLCFILGTSDISAQLDKIEERFYESFLTETSVANVAVTDGDKAGVFVAKTEGEDNFEQFEIASVCGPKEGFYWKVPLLYLRDMISEDINQRNNYNQEVKNEGIINADQGDCG